MSALGRDSKHLVDAGRAGDDPSAEDRARIRRRLVQLGVGGAVTTAATTTVAAATAKVVSVAPSALAKATLGAAAGGSGTAVGVAVASSTFGVAAKIAVAFAIVGVVGAAGSKSVSVYRAHHPVVISTAATGTASVVQVAALETAAREATPTSPPLQAAVRAAEPSEEPTPVVSVPQASPREKSPASLAANAVPQVESTLEIETRLLRDAEALRRAGNGARALVLLDEHAARFPNGVLAEERTAARVFALCDLGRVSDASGEAQRFLAERPRSPLAARVRASCAEALSR